MSDSLKQHWCEELELFYVPEDTSVEWINLEFKSGYEKYNRDGLIFTGPNGASEASPLPNYFDNSYQCIRGALDSIGFELPKPLRSKEEVLVNDLVSNECDIEKLIDPRCIKVKVTSIEDVALVKKVRDHFGSNVKIRVDCNGAFDVEAAKKLVDDLKSVDLEFVEQPCASNEDNAELRKLIDLPIAIDETANSREDIDEIQTLDAGDLIVVKVQSSGGVFAALDAIDQWGKDFVISSMMESPVGLELGFVLAQSVDTLKYASGLAASPINNIVREPLY